MVRKQFSLSNFKAKLLKINKIDIFSTSQYAFVCKKSKNNATTPRPWTTPPPTGNCEKGFTRFQNQCYKLISDNYANWTTAKKDCKSYHYFNLASVHSLKENAFIATLASEVNASWDKEVWIGGHATSEGGDSFLWSDYSEFNVDNWAKFQPDEVLL